MIYNKKPPNTTPSNHLCFSQQPSQARQGIADVRSNSKTREIPITSYHKDQVMPFVPIQVKKSDVKRRFKQISRSYGSKKLTASIILSFSFCICVCVTLAYLAFSGIYAPKEICTAVLEMCKSVYSPQNNSAQNVKDLISPTYNNLNFTTTAKSPLSGTPYQTIFPSASQGEQIDPPSTPPTSSSSTSDTLQASTATSSIGTSGVDGKLYYPLTTRNLSCDDVTLLNNQTSYAPNTSALSSKTPLALQNLSITDEPLVLILHTHATECYSESGSDATSYLSSEPTRLDDTDKNVVRVGKELSDTLTSFGINTIHVTQLHDKASFINAYTESKKSVDQYLKEYPSIRFVIDLHRDAITSGNQKSKLVTSYGDQSYAQLMFVVGTDEVYGNHPNWQDNLSLALHMQKASNNMYPGLFRKTNLRNVSFNQQMSNGYMLLEVGTCGNNLSEALRSANAFGTVLAGEILKNAAAS